MNRATRRVDVVRALVALRGHEVDAVIEVHGRPQRWCGVVQSYTNGTVRMLVSGTKTEIEFLDSQVVELGEWWCATPKARASIEQVQASRLGRMRSR